MRNKFEEKVPKSVENQAAEPPVLNPVTQSKEEILSFVVPKEIVDLPSRGKFYPPSHPLHNKEYIEVKQMTAKEEDILTNKSYVKKGLVVDKLIESILVDKNIDVSTMLVGDKNAIMVASRTAAYGAYYDVTVSCGECGKKNLISIDLLQIVTKDIPTIEEDIKNNSLFAHQRLENGNILIKLPKTGWDAECKLLTGKDERAILSYLETKKKKDPEADITISDQLNFIIFSINGVSDLQLIETAIDMMPAGDAKHLRKVYQKLIPNVVIQKKYNCSSCAEEQELEVPFTQEFFWPK